MHNHVSMPVSEPKPLTSFHPMQTYRHLMNRWGSLSHRRTSLAAEKARIIAEVDKRCKEINAEIAELNESENSLINEGRTLLPDLRNWPRVHKTLIDLVTTI